MFRKTVYHGTLKERTFKILKNEFYRSTKKTEWLGHGVYFFEDLNYAQAWAYQEGGKTDPAKEPAVLSATIQCEDNEFFDLDIAENMKKLEAMRKLFSQKSDLGHAIIGPQELRCAACNLYKKLNGIKIFAYSFPKVTTNVVGFPVNSPQRQFCVDDVANICNVTIIPMEEVVNYDL